jgi:flagellar biosynthesis component FlhA
MNPQNNQAGDFGPPISKKKVELGTLNKPQQRSPFSVVEGHPALIRDERTKAVLNMNINDYKSYQELKKIKEKENNRIKSLENDINSVKNDLGEIKSLLRSLVNGNES